MIQSLNSPNKYNLEERTAVFAESIISLVLKLPKSPVNSRIIDQLVGSSGSIAANYCEAIEGESKKDFVHKIGIRLLAKAHPEISSELRATWKEAQELLLIFSKIISTSRKSI